MPELPKPVTTKWRHKKRGTVYEVVGSATLQSADPNWDGYELIIYRGEDGKMWARQPGEFYDGRFEEPL